MTKEEMILDTVQRIEQRQEQQRVSLEEFKSLLAAHSAHIEELRAGHGRHREEHKSRDWWMFTGLVSFLAAALYYIWERRGP